MKPAAVTSHGAGKGVVVGTRSVRRGGKQAPCQQPDPLTINHIPLGGRTGERRGDGDEGEEEEEGEKRFKVENKPS